MIAVYTAGDVDRDDHLVILRSDETPFAPQPARVIFRKPPAQGAVEGPELQRSTGGSTLSAPQAIPEERTVGPGRQPAWITLIWFGVCALFGSGSTIASTAHSVMSAELAVQPWLGDLPGMVERRVIRVLTVYGPGRYYLDDGPQGTTVEFTRELEKTINERFSTGNLRIYVVCIPVARNELFPALIAGRGDIIIAGTTITAARAADVDFTIPATKPLREILISGPTAPTLATVDDLSGHTVYLRPSSSYADSIRALNRQFRERGLDPVRVTPVDEALEDEDIIEMVNAGLLPWAIVDDYKPVMWHGVFENITVRDDIVLREGAQLAWAVRHESRELKALLNEFLRTHREGTLFGNIMRNRYVRDFDWAGNALAAAELARYRELKQYFTTFGERYRIDPSLLAAQGYQESRLDQSVRSAAGAVGVMQLLPSTAADKHVDIPDIHQVKPNIEAGAKYLAFLRERYFADPELDQLDASLLALAAYNAGPARVRQLRSIAAERGYDPNRWFDHVEVIAAEKIGRETVQYVANIFKYYLSYRWIDERAKEREAARHATGMQD